MGIKLDIPGVPPGLCIYELFFLLRIELLMLKVDTSSDPEEHQCQTDLRGIPEAEGHIHLSCKLKNRVMQRKNQACARPFSPLVQVSQVTS